VLRLGNTCKCPVFRRKVDDIRKKPQPNLKRKLTSSKSRLYQTKIAGLPVARFWKIEERPPGAIPEKKLSRILGKYCR